jgi:thiol-disulfide isomerase/thioredoxin
LLIEDVLRSYKGRVEYVVENMGESEIAKRNGVKAYPAVFVNEILFVQPDDIGWSPTGKYMPIGKRENQDRFRADLRKILDLAVAGDLDGARKQGRTAMSMDNLPTLPQVDFKPLNGPAFNTASLAGKVVILDMWATWCPPCRKSLPEMSKLAKQFGDKLVILGLAVDSKEEDIKGVIEKEKLLYPVLTAPLDLRNQLGGVQTIPVFYIFDQKGQPVDVIYGAPDDLHKRLEAIVKQLLSKSQ